MSGMPPPQQPPATQLQLLSLWARVTAIVVYVPAIVAVLISASSTPSGGQTPWYGNLGTFVLIVLVIAGLLTDTRFMGTMGGVIRWNRMKGWQKALVGFLYFFGLLPLGIGVFFGYLLIVRSAWPPRTKAILGIAWVVFFAIVGIIGVSIQASLGPHVVQSPQQASDQTFPLPPSATQTQARASAGTAAPTPSPSPSPTPKPTPTPPPPATASPAPILTDVTFVNAPLTAARGSNATLQVRTAPNTSCSIEVDYSSGPSKAAGLGPATSDAAGNVSWTWKVGTNTTRGSWPITVTCGSASAQTHITVT